MAKSGTTTIFKVTYNNNQFLHVVKSTSLSTSKKWAKTPKVINFGA